MLCVTEGCPVTEQGNHQKRVEKTEAIARLNAANLGQVAHELANWRSENGTDQGWDGWIKGAHPDVVDVIWT
jgi:lipopolysaccharide biosynthesis regulator YciM